MLSVTDSIPVNEGKISMKIDETIREYIVEQINLPPNFHAPNIIIGMFIINMSIPNPGKKGNTLFNTIAIPETPPGAN
jgi:hypothetical protein